MTDAQPLNFHMRYTSCNVKPSHTHPPCEPEADKQKTKTVGSLANTGGPKDWLSLKLACWRLFQGSQKALHLLSQRRWNALLDIDWQLNDVSTRSRHRLLCSGGCSSSHPQGVRPGKEAGWILCRTNWKVRWHIKPSRTTGPFPDGTPGCSEALDELRKRTVAFQLENVWPFGANVLGHSTQHEGPKETVAGLMQKWLKAKEFWWIE